ncbi:rev protein [Simian immunodeficiency virus]|uniref:Protein Rev n=1 Tax=Simian immunodeficiency virus TaxID=11723 RepID=A0A0D4CID3_SIV|nr:rev protein [Simian immunodeficiency virus]
MAGRSEEDQQLLQAIKVIKILYQSNPFPTPHGTRNARKNRRRRWRRRQAQVDSIATRILASLIPGPQDNNPVELPSLEQLSIQDPEDTKPPGTGTADPRTKDV